MHVILLGDSIFDNGSYTRGEPDVVTHLRELLPRSHTATLLAVDGAVVANVSAQLRRVPVDATHLVISAGGNDALGNTDLLALPVQSTTEALEIFRKRSEVFEKEYVAMVGTALRAKKPVTLCTIYNGNLPPAEARIALLLFNDVILRTAVAHALPVIELRLVCTEPSDYANPIEPSGRGGRKIAQAIVRSLEAATIATRVVI
ncbi:MAG: SGNH/GDSL hydrolase family protein [Acidobacteria bacterium]|nr:SGNH/GDSL hydrolase family protein [Acidobacteriota bacterium]MBV9474861.1 SGNH/GDSL hydrolase family protein [Acidobacteriota bacterium]